MFIEESVLKKLLAGHDQEQKDEIEARLQLSLSKISSSDKKIVQVFLELASEIFEKGEMGTFAKTEHNQIFKSRLLQERFTEIAKNPNHSLDVVSQFIYALWKPQAGHNFLFHFEYKLIEALNSIIKTTPS
jgi:DNA-binding transcriptional regulator GbsR (MarR family)